MRQLCRGTRRDGQPCQAWPMRGSDYCYAHHSQLISDRPLARDDIGLSHSHMLKMLLYGSFHEESRTIVQRLRNLKEVDPERYADLAGVCNRLDYKDRLRYGLSLTAKSDEIQFLKYQRDRLVAYLTATCIDVVANENFQSFPDWLRRELKSQRRSDEIRMLAESLSSAETSTELIDALADSMISSRPNTVAYRYYEEKGGRRGFEQVLFSFSDWLKEWLSEAYFIVSGNILNHRRNAFTSLEWLRLDTHDRLKEIANYLYRDVRNTFTHTVKYRPTLEDRWGSYGTTIEGIQYWFRPIYDGEDVEREIGLQQGYSESDVIQLIVVSYLRKNWLLLEDDETFLENYWSQMQFWRARANFLFEMRRNIALIQAWCTSHLSPNASRTRPLSRIQTEAAVQFIEVWKARGGSHLSAIFRDGHVYLHAAHQVNQMIDDFNESDDARDSQKRNQLFRELCGMRASANLVWFIKDVRRNLLDNEFSYYPKQDAFQASKRNIDII